MSRFNFTPEVKPPGVIPLIVLLSFIFLVGFAFAALVLFSSAFDRQLFDRSFCFTNDCVKKFINDTDQAFLIVKSTLDLGVSIATIGGIFVALVSYFSAASNSALTNHIEHLKVFGDYIDAEIRKRDRLSSNLIDTLLLYGKIFNQSRSGKTSVSEEYKKFMVDLNLIIEESNSRCTVGTPGGFSYGDHQRRVRDHLIKAGITVYTAPRNDYFETEAQLLSLLHRIGQSFCPPGSLPEIARRNYY